MSGRKSALTPADLAVLALLTEEPRHGYDLNKELQQREAADWAGISRAQVYYSLRKLERSKLIRSAADHGPELGPERTTFKVTAAGLRGLQEALRSPTWAIQRPPPPFMTWLALSPYGNPDHFQEVVEQRRAYLLEQAAKERRTLEGLTDPTTTPERVEYLLVSHAHDSFSRELEWLDEVEQLLVHGEKPRRQRLAKARKKPRKSSSS